jgi:bifunctional non-homologous end joining protein LigD
MSGVIGTRLPRYLAPRSAELACRRLKSIVALRAFLPIRVKARAMSPVVKRSGSQAVRSGPSRGSRSRIDSPLPRFIPPQLSQAVEKPPPGPQWLHEIKLDGFRRAARIDHGRALLLTRTGLD